MRGPVVRRAALLAAFVTACQSPPAPLGDATADGALGDVAAPAADAAREDGDALDAADLRPTDPSCSAAHCAARPIVFVHGFRGDNSDWQQMLDGLVATDARYDGYHLAGVDDHAAWVARTIGRREWLFAFDYYVAHEGDGRDSYTAGPGRIGSNADHACAAPPGPGHIVAEDARYAADATHEYAADLAGFVRSVLRATGADAVDLVGHSQGGLVARSFLAFHGGAAIVERVLLLASPVRGVSLAGFLTLFPAGHPAWMIHHEIAEIDGGTPFVERAFRLCDEEPASPGAWASKLTDHELAQPPAVQLHVMSGVLDLPVNRFVADHPLALTHRQAVADHSGMLAHAEVIARVRDLLGGEL